MDTTESEMDTSRNEGKDVEVTVRTPAGHPYEFTFKNNEKVSKATSEAVEHFVASGELADGDYGLALIKDGRTVELAAGARLDDYGVEDKYTLALYNKRPQVDGDSAPAA